MRMPVGIAAEDRRPDVMPAGMLARADGEHDAVRVDRRAGPGPGCRTVMPGCFRAQRVGCMIDRLVAGAG
jgi:hypothetical protein